MVVQNDSNANVGVLPRNRLETKLRASSGHSWNQLIVQQLINAGNFAMVDLRKKSDILQHPRFVTINKNVR